MSGLKNFMKRYEILNLLSVHAKYCCATRHYYYLKPSLEYLFLFWFCTRLTHIHCLVSINIASIPIGSSESKGSGSCETHEQYLCGPTCIETCDYKPELCTADCRFSCFCKDGYVWQSNQPDSPCIKKEQCNKNKCGEDEEYNTCGSACPPSCSDFSYPQKTKFCTLQCVTDCFCKRGLYRAKDGTCVPAKKCCQGANEYYTDCGTTCPKRCGYQPEAMCCRLFFKFRLCSSKQ
jgi:hypothetical protein